MLTVQLQRCLLDGSFAARYFSTAIATRLRTIINDKPNPCAVEAHRIQMSFSTAALLAHFTMRCNHKSNWVPRLFCQSSGLESFRSYSQHATTSGLDKPLNPTESAKRKAKGKTAAPESILLISDTENVSVSTLPEAEKLSRKKGFRLVQVVALEHKLHTDKKVYKFESLAQHFGEDWKKKHDGAESDGKEKNQRKKEEKTVLMTSKITGHDLEAKMKQVNRLVTKGHPLRVFISGGGDPEFVFKGIQKHLSPIAKIHQKKTSSTEIRLQIVPQTPEGVEEGATEGQATKYDTKGQSAKVETLDA